MIDADDRPSLREESDKFRALQIDMQAYENYKKLTERIAKLEATLRAGIDVVNSEYGAPHPDTWIDTTRILLESK